MIRQRGLVFILLAMLPGCDKDVTQPIDPVSECVPVCGPADLAVVSAQVIMPPGQTVVYSGDTVRLSVAVQNLSAVTSDSAYISTDLLPYGPNLIVPVGHIPPDTVTTHTVSVVMPLVNSSHDTANARRWRVSAFSMTDFSSGNNMVLTSPMPMRPTVIRASGPDTIFVGEATTYQITVTNPSPRALAPATISTCYVYFNCFGPALSRTVGPTVPAGASVTFPIVVAVPLDAERMTLPVSGALLACYGRLQFGGCGAARTVLKARP